MMQFLRPDLTPERHDRDQQVVFLVDMTCPNITQYLEMSAKEQHFRSPFRWLLLTKSEAADGSDDESIIPAAIRNIDVLLDSEVVLAIDLGNHSYVAHLIYRISAGSEWRTEHYGSWDHKNRFQKGHLIDSAARRRANLEGYVISVCYVLTDADSVNHLMDGIDDHIDTITKVNFPTTNHLLDFLHAGRRLVFTDTWGYRVNGSWNGMTGYLVRREVEIGGSPMFFTSERASLVDYVSSPTPTRSKFVFQQPKLSYENNLFLLSFRTTVWYSSIALIFLLYLALLAVAFWEWKKNAHQYKQREENASILRAKVSDVVLLVFGATCQQGSYVELKGSLGRVVMLVLFLALMFLYTSYSANIVALLQSSSSQIRTLEDLLHSRIKFGVHDTVYSRYYFSTATEPVRKAIYLKKVAPPGQPPRYMSLEEGVKNMQKGLFAFHMETGVGYKFVGKYFQEGEKCGLKEIQYLQVIDPWLAVRRNTPFKEMFKIGLKRIQEHGLQNRENLLFYEKKPKCSGRGAIFISVSMVDCYPALLIFAYGCIVSIAMLLLELMYKKRQDMKISTQEYYVN
ncbi:hypothetical protein JYU34_012845 [Plutella xylostella]|uniref:Uncharacterized protein n=1 Tax=Plutella xylostella TaxID=51655 RepID=A0ABQ7QCA6_PLUXY|nr:hypothetical protein JYU34_012845 [Plutella xylostella]